MHDEDQEITEVRPARGGRVVTALLGFVAGAVFWHLVGFWALVSEMVFSGPREKTIAVPASREILAREAALASAEPVGAPIKSRSEYANGRTAYGVGRGTLSSSKCVTLAQARPGGPIKEVPCPVGAPLSRADIVNFATGGITTGSISRPFDNSGALSDSLVRTLGVDDGWSASLELDTP